MDAFTTLTGVTATLSMINVDTDMIIPKQFLKTIKRTGLGAHLFDEMRFLEDGSPNPEFILNQAPYDHAKILISGSNFGCGSSREHAPWSLLDFGIRSILAPSFADIFYNNCFKNGILPITLAQKTLDEITLKVKESTKKQLTVDLPNQQVYVGNDTWEFNIEPFRKQCLLQGLDDIALTLKHVDRIDAFEASTKERCPWLFDHN